MFYIECEKPSSSRPKRKVDELLNLQQETLAAVNQLVVIQTSILEVKKEKLQVQKELLDIRKIELLAKGIGQDECGNWVVLQNSKEEE